jgi:hypothetical protein
MEKLKKIDFEIWTEIWKNWPYHQREMKNWNIYITKIWNEKIEIFYCFNLQISFFKFEIYIFKFEMKISVWNLKKNWPYHPREMNKSYISFMPPR